MARLVQQLREEGERLGAREVGNGFMRIGFMSIGFMSNGFLGTVVTLAARVTLVTRVTREAGMVSLVMWLAGILPRPAGTYQTNLIVSLYDGG